LMSAIAQVSDWTDRERITNALPSACINRFRFDGSCGANPHLSTFDLTGLLAPRGWRAL
jgi:hypothetical protein